jgi:hypothetical protein
VAREIVIFYNGIPPKESNQETAREGEESPAAESGEKAISN